MKKFSINPVALVVWLWLVIMNGIIVATNYIFAIVIHELGHFLTAKKLGYRLSKFSLSPYGVELSYFGQNLNYRDELIIAFAGPLANFVSVFFVLGLWWVVPTIYFFTESFVCISLLIALVNLHPAYPLDGGRIFVSIGSHFVKEKTAKKITLFVNIFLGIIFFVLFVIFLFINFNPSLLLFSLFLFAGILDLRFSSKFEKINIFTKTMKNFTKPNIYCVGTETTLSELLSKLETTKTIIFCVILESGKIVNLSEKMVINLSLNFPINTKLNEILINKKIRINYF